MPRIADRQIPELMLQHDRHFFRILRAQARRNLHAGRAGVERDEEVMLARQAVARRIGDDVLDDAAQCVANQKVVADVID